MNLGEKLDGLNSPSPAPLIREEPQPSRPLDESQKRARSRKLVQPATDRTAVVNKSYVAAVNRGERDSASRRRLLILRGLCQRREPKGSLVPTSRQEQELPARDAARMPCLPCSENALKHKASSRPNSQPQALCQPVAYVIHFLQQELSKMPREETAAGVSIL